MRCFPFFFATFVLLLATAWSPHEAFAQGDSDFKFLEVKVLDPDGKPLADVEVDISMDGSEFPMPTDEDGIVGFNVPTGDNTRMRLKVSRPGYAAMGASWGRGMSVPEEFTIRMEKGKTIGGVVHDEQGRPIKGAEVTGTIFWHADTGELRPTMQDEVSTTDAEGKWQLKSAPISDINLQFKITHPDYVSKRGYSRHSWSWEELQAQDQVYVLEKGIEIRGRVLDPDGQPVRDAQVAVGNSRFDSRRQIVSTNASGEYVLSKLKAGNTFITVTSSDWAPDLCIVKTKPQTEHEPVDFHLEPPQTVRIRVVTPEGTPLPGITIIPENWRGSRSLEDPFGRKKTNQEGIWEWHAAPTDEVQYSIFAQGRFTLQDSAAGFLPSDGIQDIVMYPAAVVTGNVIDKKTRQPIENFYYVEGVWWRADSSRFILQRKSNTKLGKKGSLSFTMTSGCIKYLIQVEAEGYRASRSREILPDEGSVHLEFELEPSQAINGIVKLPNGQPAAGVQVAIATLGQGVYPFNGRLGQLDSYPNTVTDAQGRYTFSSIEEAYQVVYLHEVGMAERSEQEHGTTAEVVLIPWARVEGQIMPSARLSDTEQATLRFAAQDSQRTGVQVGWYYREKPDEKGRFVFERVPPRPAIVSGSFSFGDPGNMRPENTHTQEVELTPSETTTVQIGGTGQKVQGQLSMPEAYEGEIPWHRGSVKLTSKKNQRSFATEIALDGRFVINDVLPGQYELETNIYNLSVSGQRWMLLASAKQTCTIADQPAEAGTAELDLGKISLELKEQ